tara:strand:- start:19278 stop:20477 length:1200 start_codon:yes stop_codon:yes gene_type:complete
MSDIRKRTGKTGTTYQVRYPSNATSSGYAFKSFRTVKAARHFLAERIIEGPGEPGVHKPISVVDAVNLWLNVCENIGRDGREKVEPQTLVEYRRRAKVIREYRWEKYVNELLPTDVIAFRSWLLENKSRDLARRCLSSFHSVLLEMMLQGYSKNDPAAGVSIKSGGRYEDKEVEIPSDIEMGELYEAIDRLASSGHSQKRDAWQKYRPMFYLAGFSGMRPSEYRGLPSCNLSPNSVAVTQRADKTGIVGPVKSRAAKREIALPNVVSEMLHEWRNMGRFEDGDLLFGTAGGKPMLLTNLYHNAWLPLMREADLMETGENGHSRPKYSMYSLRHYYASKLIESNQDFKYIQKVMGHSKIEITFNNYGHLIRGNEQAHKDAANALANSVLKTCGKSVASGG